MHPKETLAYIHFLRWQDLFQTEKPFQIFRDIHPESKDQRQTNLIFDPFQVSVQNIRGLETQFDLDTQGFKIVHLSTFEKAVHGRSVESLYLPQVQNLLEKEFSESRRIAIFDWRKRELNANGTRDVIDLEDRSAPLKPTNYAHIDATPLAVIQRVQKELGCEATDLLKSRLRIINVWRPIENTVEDWPLAICDGSTIDPSALVETDQVRNTDVGSNYFAMHRSCNEWYYLHHQREDEVFLFKQFDSDPHVAAKWTIHASFQHDDIRADVPPRQSIEVRAMVFSLRTSAADEACQLVEYDAAFAMSVHSSNAAASASCLFHGRTAACSYQVFNFSLLQRYFLETDTGFCGCRACFSLLLQPVVWLHFRMMV